MRTRPCLPSSYLVGALALLMAAAGCGGGGKKKPFVDAGGDDEMDGPMAVVDTAPRPDLGGGGQDARRDVAPDVAPASDGGGDARTETGVDASGDAGGSDAGGADGGDGGSDAGPSCMTMCTVGDKRCGAGGGLQTCMLDATGCAVWTAEAACGANQQCAGTGAAAACSCKPAPTGCTAEGKFCASGGSEAVCAKDANGCFYQMGAATTCAANQSCKAGSCSCDNTCQMGDVGTYCKDAKTVASCAASAGCFLSSAPVACQGAKTCVRDAATSMAACQCPAAGAKLGAGCTLGAADSCDGANIITCVADPQGSGCPIWAVKKDCATDTAGPLTCGTKSGAAACQCGEPTGEINVDPIAGSDAASGLYPTGAAQPAACRFKTLTKGLSAVTSAPTKRVVAHGAAAGAPAVFGAGETFPLAVPMDTALTTADATPAPANYKIAFAGALAPAAVTLATGASFSGFTIESSTGNPLGAVITCSAGSVNVQAVALSGTGGGAMVGTGIAVGTAAGGTDTCSATIGNAAISGFGTGIAVSSAGAGGTSLSDVTLTDNATGVRIAAGSVTATRLTIAKATGTAERGVSLAGVSAATAPTFTGVDVKVTGMTVRGLDVTLPAGMAAPQVALTGGEIGGSGGDGVNVEGGTVSLTGTNVHDSGDEGLDQAGGAVTIGAGAKFDANGSHGIWVRAGTLTGTGFSASGNTNASLAMSAVDGVHVSSGTVALHGAALSNNKHRGLAVLAGTVTLDDGSVVRQNGATAGSSGVRFEGGTLALGGAQGAQVEIADNGLHGVNVETPNGSTGAAISITRALIHDNAGDGLRVNLDGTGHKLTMSASDVYKNAKANVGASSSNAGIVIHQAPSNSVNAVTIDGTVIRENGRGGATGVGIWLRGDLGDVTATITNGTIRDNGDYGVLVEQGGGKTTRETLQANTITNNNLTAGRQIGGIFFASSSTLASFTANKIFGNGGDEVGFDAPPNGGTTWNLQPPTATCDAMANQIYCYGTNRVGISITTNANVGVNASNVSWANASPSNGIDFSALGAASVTFANPCAAKACP